MNKVLEFINDFMNKAEREDSVVFFSCLAGMLFAVVALLIFGGIWFGKLMALLKLDPHTLFFLAIVSLIFWLGWRVYRFGKKYNSCRSK